MNYFLYITDKIWSRNVENDIKKAVLKLTQISGGHSLLFFNPRSFTIQVSLVICGRQDPSIWTTNWQINRTFLHILNCPELQCHSPETCLKPKCIFLLLLIEFSCHLLMILSFSGNELFDFSILKAVRFLSLFRDRASQPGFNCPQGI